MELDSEHAMAMWRAPACTPDQNRHQVRRPSGIAGSIVALRSFVTTNCTRLSTPPTLLVVDDDPEVRLLLCELFAEKGFSIQVAEDGAAAILLLTQNALPSVILLDLVMPGILGTGVLAYLGSKPSLESIPVAIMSATPHLAPQGYPVFKKPFKFASLLEFVRRACDAGAPGNAAPGLTAVAH